MIPTEVADLATLIWPHWAEMDDDDGEDKVALKQILDAAYRIYTAGYRRPPEEVGG